MNCKPNLYECAQYTRSDYRVDLPEGWSVAVVLIDREQFPHLHRSFDQSLGFGQVTAHGFLDQNVFSSIQSSYALLGMLIARRGHYYQIELFCDQVIKPLKGPTTKPFLRLLTPLNYRIHHCRNVIVRQLGERLRMQIPTTTPQTCNPNLDTFLNTHERHLTIYTPAEASFSLINERLCRKASRVDLVPLKSSTTSHPS